MMDWTDADGEWSDDDGVKSGSATALSDNELDERPKSLKITTTITTSPTNQKKDPVHAILDKIDAELGVIAAANNITSFSQPQSVKKSTFPTFDRTKLEAQGVVFDTDDNEHRGRTVLGRTRGGSSDRDTGVGTGSVHDDAGSEHKRIMGSAQIHSDVADLTDVQTDEDGRKGDEGHSDLDSVAAQQIDEKFKEIMRKKRGGYLDDLRARIPRPGSDRDTVNSEEGLVSRRTDPISLVTNRRSRSIGPLGKPPRPMPRNCLTPPSSPWRGPRDFPPHPRQTYDSSPTLKQNRPTPQPFTGYASDLDSVKTEDFESRFQDLIIGPQSKDPPSKLKTVSKKLAKPESNSQVQSKMSLNNKSSYPRPSMEPKSFKSSSLFSNFQNRPKSDLALRKTPFSSSLPQSESRNTKDIMKLPRPRSVSPARLSSLAEHGRQRTTGLFSWDDDFWKTKTPKRPGSSASTFEEVESLCHSKSSSSVDSHHVKGRSKTFGRQSSATSTSTGASSGHLADREFCNSENRSQSISSVGSVGDEAENFDLPHQLSDSHYMERIFQRVLDWKTGEPTNDNGKYENWNTAQLRSTSSKLLDFTVPGQKKGRKKILIIPDEETEDFPFAKMKFNHKPDFCTDSPDNIVKKSIPPCNSSSSMRSSQRDSNMSQQSEYSFPASQTSVSSYSTDISSWQESFRARDRPSLESIDGQYDSRPSLGSRSVSVDNLSTFPPAPPVDYYAPYNPFLPVHAERMLMNLGFSGTDSLLPERFLKDWYQKMAKAQLESQQHGQHSDGLDSAVDSVAPSLLQSGRSTPSKSYMYPEQLAPFPSGRFLQRSATVSSYHYPETFDIPGKICHKTPLRNNYEQSTVSHSSNLGDNGVARRRHQWTNSRQKSLPLFLETLNEEDESRTRNTSIDKYSKLKAFLAEEMSVQSSESGPDQNNIDSESDTNSSKSENISITVISAPPESTQSSKHIIPFIVASDNPAFSDKNGQRKVPEIKHELPPSTDSLEIADIMQNPKQKRSMLEPAMVSIVLEDVDGNVTSSSSHLGLSEDHLHIPLSRCSSSSISPIPLSPVTVIEVGLDNQQDSMDTDEGASTSTSNKESFDSDPSKSETTKSFKVGGLLKNPNICSKMKLEASLQLHQSTLVEADDGTLSPITKFSPIEYCQEWHGENSADDYYIAHDQSTQCCMENTYIYVCQCQQANVHSSHTQVQKLLIDKETQMSPVLTTVTATQTEMEDFDDLGGVGYEMYQNVITNNITNIDLEGAVVKVESLNNKTVRTISPQLLCENIPSSLEERRHSITDDWIISEFKAEVRQNLSIPGNHSLTGSQDVSGNVDRNDKAQTSFHRHKSNHEDNIEMDLDLKVQSRNEDSKTGSISELTKFNDDGSHMTKLDMFATEFLTEAEKYCASLRSVSESEDIRRKDSLLSSTLSNDSWGTQNTVIFNATNLKTVSSAPEESVSFQEQHVNDLEDQMFDNNRLINLPCEENSFLIVSENTSKSQYSIIESPNVSDVTDSGIKMPEDVNEKLIKTTISSSQSSVSTDRHKLPERCYFSSKAHSFDTPNSGHSLLRRTQALSFPLESENGLSWSIFSTSVSSESTDESDMSLQNGYYQNQSDHSHDEIPTEMVSDQSLTDSAAMPSQNYQSAPANGRTMHNVQSQQLDSFHKEDKSPDGHFSKLTDSSSLSYEETVAVDDNLVKHSLSDTTSVGCSKDVPASPSIGTVDYVSGHLSSWNARIETGDLDGKEGESCESVCSENGNLNELCEADKCHLTHSDLSSDQKCKTEEVNCNVSLSDVDDDLKHTESANVEVVNAVKMSYRTRFMVNTFSRNIKEAKTKDDADNLIFRHERHKQGSGSYLGSQMTTIFESEFDHSDSENLGKDNTSEVCKAPELTKSRSWNGNHLSCTNQLTTVKSHSLNSHGKIGDFARLARKAFVGKKTKRVTSPCELSNGKEPGASEIKTVNVVQCDTHLCRTYSNESSEKQTLYVSQRTNYSPSVMEELDKSMGSYSSFNHMSDSETPVNIDGHLLPECGKNVSPVYSNTTYVNSKRFILTPSPTVEKNQIKSVSGTLSRMYRPKSESGPELNDDNSFKPISSETNIFPDSEVSSHGRSAELCNLNLLGDDFGEVPTVIVHDDEKQVSWQKSEKHNSNIDELWLHKTFTAKKESTSPPLSSMDTISHGSADMRLNLSSWSPSSSPEASSSSPDSTHHHKDSLLRSLSPSDRRRLAGPAVCISPIPRKGTLISPRFNTLSPMDYRKQTLGIAESPSDSSAESSFECKDVMFDMKSVCKSPTNIANQTVEEVRSIESEWCRQVTDESPCFTGDSASEVHNLLSSPQMHRDIRYNKESSAFTEFQTPKMRKHFPSGDKLRWTRNGQYKDDQQSQNKIQNYDTSSGSKFSSLCLHGEMNTGTLSHRPNLQDTSRRFSPMESETVFRKKICDADSSPGHLVENNNELLPINIRRNIKNKIASSGSMSPHYITLENSQIGIRRSTKPTTMPHVSQTYTDGVWNEGESLFANHSPRLEVEQKHSQNNNIIGNRNSLDSKNLSNSRAARVLRFIEVTVKPLDVAYKFEDLTSSDSGFLRQNVSFTQPQNYNQDSQAVCSLKQDNKCELTSSVNERTRTQNRKKLKPTVSDIKSMFESGVCENNGSNLPSTNSRKMVHKNIKNLVNLFENR